MVGLPSVETREIIFKTILAKENTENLDFKELAVMTEGYTGSDLKVFLFSFIYFDSIFLLITYGHHLLTHDFF